MTRGFVCALASFVLMAGQALAQEREYGSWQCTWYLLSHFKTISDQCFPNDDLEIKAVLEYAISKIETFVRKNEQRADSHLQEIRDILQASVERQQGHLCSIHTNEWLSVYQRGAAKGADRLRAGVAEMFSVPDKPKWSECP